MRLVPQSASQLWNRITLGLWRFRDAAGGRVVGTYISMEDRVAPKRLRLSFGFGLIVVAAAAVIGAKGISFPSAEFWNDDSGKVVLMGAVVANALGGLLLVADYRALVRAQNAADDLTEACRTLMDFVADRLEIAVGQVGVHVWEVRGIWPVRYLTRVATSQPRRPPTAINWRKRKGAIGQCWKHRDDILADVGHLADISESEFEALRPRERFNLRWREFDRVRMFPTVFAVRLSGRFRNARALAGVLSIDLKVAGRTQDLRALWEKHLDAEISDILATCNDALAR